MKRIVKFFLSRLVDLLARVRKFYFPAKFQWNRKLEMLFGKYEKDTTREFKRIIKPGMTVVDIGAHIGYFTRLSSKLSGKTGRVLAFEPEPDNYQLLEKNTKGKSNVSIRNTALADKTGERNFYKSVGKTGSHSLIPSDFREIKTTVKVEILDNFLAERRINRVDVIKMDIEGGEPLALKGMMKTLENNPGIQIVMEFSTINLRLAGFDPLQVLRPLSQMGFGFKSIEDNAVLSINSETITAIDQKLNSFVNLLISRIIK